MYVGGLISARLHVPVAVVVLVSSTTSQLPDKLFAAFVALTKSVFAFDVPVHVNVPVPEPQVPEVIVRKVPINIEDDPPTFT